MISIDVNLQNIEVEVIKTLKNNKYPAGGNKGQSECYGLCLGIAETELFMTAGDQALTEEIVIKQAQMVLGAQTADLLQQTDRSELADVLSSYRNTVSQQIPTIVQQTAGRDAVLCFYPESDSVPSTLSIHFFKRGVVLYMNITSRSVYLNEYLIKDTSAYLFLGQLIKTLSGASRLVYRHIIDIAYFDDDYLENDRTYALITHPPVQGDLQTLQGDIIRVFRREQGASTGTYFGFMDAYLSGRSLLFSHAK